MSAAKGEPGWGEGLSSQTPPELRDHPTPPLRVDPPPPGEGKKPRALAMTRVIQTRFDVLATQSARALPLNFRPPCRGRRECRAPDAPAAACAKAELKKHTR